MPEESVLVDSDRIFQCRTAQNVRQEYFTQVVRTSGSQQHCLAVGDVCAIRDAEGKRSPPFSKEAAWVIGQVLAIFVQRESMDCSTYHVVTRRLARWKEEGKDFSQKTSLKNMEKRGFFRPDQALLETSRVDTYALSDVLRADIRIDDSKHFIATDRRKADYTQETDSFEISFCCPCRVNDQDELLDVRSDWNNYEDRRSRLKAAPPALERGWELLESLALREALQAAWKIRARAVFPVEKKEVSMGKENTTDKPVSRKNKQGSTQTSVYGPNRKRHKADQRVHFASDAARRRPVEEPLPMDETATETTDDSTATVSLNPLPLHGSVYETTARKSQPAVVYVEGVELDVDKDVMSSPKSRKRKQDRRWQFHVGDIICVRCPDAQPAKVPFVSGKGKWFPYTLAWSVVQVISIYYEKGQEGDMQMQVRWFYRPDELNEDVQARLTALQRTAFFKGKQRSRMLVEVDEDVSDVPVESAIGRVKLTSDATPPAAWLRPLVDAVPEIGFICRYMNVLKHDDPRLHAVRDWTNYGSDSSGPLYRGLSCPKAKPGQVPKLFQRYKARMCKRLNIDTLEVSNVDDFDPEREEEGVGWRPEEINCAKAYCKPTASCHITKDREFFTSVNVQTVKERCDARGTAKKSEMQEIHVSIGDIVCIACDKGMAARPVAGNKKNAWFPYKGPWVYVQVLSIFRDRIKRSSGPTLEVRSFVRRNELPSSLAAILPPSYAKGDEEEVYESFDVHMIPAGSVLGMAEVFLGHHIESYGLSVKSKERDASRQLGIPRPKCRCAFYLTGQALQPLFCADSTPLKWSRHVLERGVTSSELIHSDTELASMIEMFLGVSFNSSKHRNLFVGLLGQEEDKPPAPNYLFEKQSEGNRVRYFSSASIPVPWSAYIDGQRLCADRDRKACWWKIAAGQVVAVKTQVSSQKTMYCHSWKPAQILAICSEETGVDEGTLLYSFHIRWFELSDSASTGAGENSFFTRIREPDSSPRATVMSSDLLGPVYIANGGSMSSIWRTVVPFLPVNVALYDDLKKSSSASFDLPSFVRSGLDASGFYSDENLQMLCGPEAEEEQSGISNPEPSPHADTSTADNESTMSQATTATITATSPPVHTDRNGWRYYTSITVKPPLSKYVKDIRQQKDRIAGDWTVTIGDVVIVNAKYGFGPARFGRLSGNPTKSKASFPFEGPWSVAEIVMIYDRPCTSNSGESSGQRTVELELRWFYRSPEISGSSLVSSDKSNILFCEEIFESDHYDTCLASALAAPALVHESLTSLGERSFLHGMPVVEFAALRFWSAKRKSLILVDAAPLARQQRGLLNSPHLMKDAKLRETVERLRGSDSKKPIQARGDWKTCFHDVIQKLSLTDASKEGFKCSKAIVGRDKEMRHILSFLRTSLKGSDKEGRCSLFIAGPPGVGKTACVRAAISELEQLRSKGQVPPFEFVCMNGMEMRYPFEAYVQLWEKISGISERPDTAASRLEAYFTKEESKASKEAKGGVRSVIVLLDEIDYLVTKNQSVLYNFFDWPTHNQKRRLIVLGVSNTLNLAEQLHTRVQSRIGSRRCIFKAYDAKQIENILRAKLIQASPDYTVFDEDAIVFVSKKTASLSGDIRRAFQICRTAAEHVVTSHGDGEAKESGTPLVTIRDALKVSRESFNSAKSQAMTRCTGFEALLLVTLASLSRSTGREFGGFDMEEILVKMEALANGLGDARYLPAPMLSEAMEVVSRLGESNIVGLQTPQLTSLTYRASLAGSGGPWPLVSLTVDDLSVLLALKKSPHKALAQKYLGINF